tara:strand:+ start:352 stop:828 length:477 start_codon:yes stop_codon:yes gene_type:complete
MKWKEILKAPILETGDKRYGELQERFLEGKDWKEDMKLYRLNTPMVSESQVFWEGDADGSTSGARGIARLTSMDGEEYFWAIEEFEVRETGKGKGEKYLLDFIADLKRREDLDIHVIRIDSDANNFWIKMLDKGHVKSISNFTRPKYTLDGKLIPRGV